MIKLIWLRGKKNSQEQLVWKKCCSTYWVDLFDQLDVQRHTVRRSWKQIRITLMWWIFAVHEQDASLMVFFIHFLQLFIHSCHEQRLLILGLTEVKSTFTHILVEWNKPLKGCMCSYSWLVSGIFNDGDYSLTGPTVSNPRFKSH